MITLLPSDPNWLSLFEQEKKILKEMLGDVASGIEYIGSTAIPGIHADLPHVLYRLKNPNG